MSNSTLRAKPYQISEIGDLATGEGDCEATKVVLYKDLQKTHQSGTPSKHKLSPLLCK